MRAAAHYLANSAAVVGDVELRLGRRQRRVPAIMFAAGLLVALVSLIDGQLDVAPEDLDPRLSELSDVIDKTNHLYRPETRRRWGPLEWPALLRLADRKYPGFRD